MVLHEAFELDKCSLDALAAAALVASVQVDSNCADCDIPAEGNMMVKAGDLTVNTLSTLVDRRCARTAGTLAPILCLPLFVSLPRRNQTEPLQRRTFVNCARY